MNSSTITSMFGIDSNNFKPTDIEPIINGLPIKSGSSNLVAAAKN